MASRARQKAEKPMRKSVSTLVPCGFSSGTLVRSAWNGVTVAAAGAAGLELRRGVGIGGGRKGSLLQPMWSVDPRRGAGP